jgi:drug/metabolite transporter (DMT)-like permease
MSAPKRSLVIIAFAALYVIWGSTYLGIKFSIETIPPFLMAGARFVLAGMIMYAIAWSQGIGKSTWANWRTSFVIGACLLLGGNGGVTISEQYIDSGLAALIVAIVPIYIVLLGWGTGMAPRPTPIMWVGLAGGFVGSEYPSCLSQASFGPRARSTRALRDTRPHHFLLLLNK